MEKFMHEIAEITPNFLQLLFNKAISNSEFPENLKLADVTPGFSKKDLLGKTYYRLSVFCLWFNAETNK